ncbi:MAG: hydrogenase expression/formation protein HypE [Candidatus Paceibacterota bacterium]|jgi:hydrogenase expression/formation protein HypE|nr:hydrogenase expression/formation protein HypE [Candidatus Paceibacterota bacterium]
MTYSLECPVTGYKETDVVTMAHGSGGESMQKLISEMFAKAFPDLQAEDDAATFDVSGPGQFATSIDSFVVDPIFFKGGNIASLSVHGTVNDLAMKGAMPLYLNVAFILEEGLPLRRLKLLVLLLARAAKKAGIKIVTGDTKVVPKGKGDGIYIITSGIGVVFCEKSLTPGPKKVSVGDKIIVSGDIGRHGMSIMSAREGFDPLRSDSAPLNEMVKSLYDRDINPKCMRDATRGGVAAVLNEIARVKKVHIRIDEEKVPVDEEIKGLAEILGYDLLHVANEGRFVLFVKPEDAEKTVKILQTFKGGEQAAIIGEVVKEHKTGSVTAETLLGTEKPILMPAGEILPRIC